MQNAGLTLESTVPNPQKGVAHIDPALQAQHEGLALESIVPNDPRGVAQKAAQHTAVQGGFGDHGEETLSCINSHDTLENKVQEGSERQEMVSLCKLPKLSKRRTRDSILFL